MIEDSTERKTVVKNGIMQKILWWLRGFPVVNNSAIHLRAVNLVRVAYSRNMKWIKRVSKIKMMY